MFLCGSVVEHCVSSAKGCGFDSQGTHVLMKMYNLNAIVKSLWIKASAKCINVNVMSQVSVLCYFMLSQALEICGQCASPIMHWAPLVSSFC